jgi:hypothetical protein
LDNSLKKNTFLIKNPGIVGTLLGLALLLSGQVQAQSLTWGEQEFLNREEYPWWDLPYENYSLLSYRDYEYGTTRDESPTYDPFGTYILDGISLLNLSESRTLVPNVRGSSISWSDAGRFRNLVIMRDQYKRWSTRLMVGEQLDIHFTPLTLAKPRLPGIRWDGSSHKNSFTIVGSRASTPNLNGGTHSFSTYLYGAHWESQLGDMLNFGLSYINLFQTDSEQRSGSLQGDFPSIWIPTRSFYLMVSDDSPEDLNGVQVLNVEVYRDGAPFDIQPEIKKVPHLARVDDVPHLRRDRAWAPQSMQADRLLNPGFGLFFQEGVAVVPTNNAPLEVGGTDLLVYRFELPADVKAENLHYKLQVAGDYSIDVGTTAQWEGLGRIFADWHNVARARGNVGDGSNMRWVSVSYGVPVGLTQFGSNVKADMFGLNMEAEYVSNFVNFLFPLHGGDRSRERNNAYFAKVLKEMGDWRLGGEYFDIPDDFQTSLPFWSEHSQKTLPYELVEDNDDRDEWADNWEQWDPLDPLYVQLEAQQGGDVEAENPTGARDYLNSGVVGYGVFPGLDKEGDGIVDINVNRNTTPDYIEPFLMYFVEPDDFVYGDDMNNNGIVDERENDNTPNYPYELDRTGFHLFAALEPFKEAKLRLGRYQVWQPAGGGRNEVSYAKLQYTVARDPIGWLDFHYRIKQVRDDIADPVYQPVVNPLSATTLSMRIKRDLLFMQNSRVNTFFAEAHYTGVRHLHFINAAKLEVNSLQGNGLGGGDRIVDWTWVSKGDYGYPFGKLTITPMAKFLLQKRSAPSDLLSPLHTWEFFPIIKADYALTERTFLRAGMQGLPGFEHLFRNERASSQDFDARHYVLNLQTKSNYVGYDISINIGFRSTRNSLINLPREPEQKFKEFFIQTRIL